MNSLETFFKIMPTFNIGLCDSNGAFVYAMVKANHTSFTFTSNFRYYHNVLENHEKVTCQFQLSSS